MQSIMPYSHSITLSLQNEHELYHLSSDGKAYACILVIVNKWQVG